MRRTSVAKSTSAGASLRHRWSRFVQAADWRWSYRIDCPGRFLTGVGRSNSSRSEEPRYIATSRQRKSGNSDHRTPEMKAIPVKLPCGTFGSMSGASPYCRDRGCRPKRDTRIDSPYQRTVALSPNRFFGAAPVAGSHRVTSRPRSQATRLFPMSPNFQPNRHSLPTSENPSPNSGVPRT